MAKSLIDEEKEFLKFAGKNVLFMVKNFEPIDSDREDGGYDKERVEQETLSNPKKKRKREGARETGAVVFERKHPRYGPKRANGVAGTSSRAGLIPRPPSRGTDCVALRLNVRI